MGTVRYTGHATNVAQIDTATPANVGIGDTFSLKLVNKDGDEYTLTYTAAAATVKDVVDGITALAATAKTHGHAPFDAVTVTDDDALNTITADAEGVPFTATCTETDGDANDTQTFTRAASTAYDGKGKFDSALNYDGDAVHAANDTLVIPAALPSTVTIYGMDATANALNQLDVEAGCGADIGSAENFLQLDLGGAATNIANLAGTGSIFLDLDNATEINVTACATGGGPDAGTYGLNLKGLDNTELNFDPGSSSATCGFGALTADAAECSTFNVASGSLTIGSAVTKVNGADAVDINVAGGQVTCRSAAGVVKLRVGTADYTQDGGNITTLHAFSRGTVKCLQECTITTAHLGPQCHLDLTDGEGAVTLTNSTIYAGATITDPRNRLTRTNASTFKQTDDNNYAQIRTGALASV